MKKQIERHFGYYATLLAILLVGTLLVATSSDGEVRILLVFITTFFYVGWGILHHFLNHDLSAKIVVEYVLVGSLGLAIILFLLRGT